MELDLAETDGATVYGSHALRIGGFCWIWRCSKERTCFAVPAFFSCLGQVGWMRCSRRTHALDRFTNAPRPGERQLALSKVPCQADPEVLGNFLQNLWVSMMICKPSMRSSAVTPIMCTAATSDASCEVISTQYEVNINA